MAQGVTQDDWRWRGQARYLSGATPHWRAWRETRPGWGHDHCAFCPVTLMDSDHKPDILREGYATDNDSHWVCAKCASDFAPQLRFMLVGGPADPAECGPA